MRKQAEEFIKSGGLKKTRRDKAWTDGEYLYLKAGPNYIYDIHLSRMKTADAVLDWIHQVCIAKTWGPSVTKDMLECIFYEIIPTDMWSGKG